MAEGPRLRLSDQQRLQLNPGLSQSLGLLRLDAAELAVYLEREAAENPWLAITPPVPQPPIDWLPRWRSTDGPVPETPGAGPSLIAHVVNRVAALRLSEAQNDIALHLIEALEPTGWIGTPLPAVAQAAGASLPDVEAVLALVQGIEPRGLFARDLAECLTLQAKEEGPLDRVMTGVLAGLDLLAKGQMAKLARSLNVATEAVQTCLQRLRGYQPKPGTLFDPLTPAHIREPDLTLRAEPDGRWLLSVNRAALPSIRLAARQAKDGDPEGALTQARSLVAMLEARHQTLLQVAEAVLARQGAAISGCSAAMRPLTMAEIGAELGLHESTISRAVAGTSIEGPHGVVWLRQLFSPEVARDPEGRGVAKAALRARLVQLIAQEDPQNRLRDADLAEALARATGIRLSRRTIAAYREEAGIPIAGRRLGAKSGLFAAKRPERSPQALSRHSL